MSFEVTGYKLGKKGLHCQQPSCSLYWRGMVICISRSMEVLLFSDCRRRKWLALSKYNLYREHNMPTL